MVEQLANVGYIQSGDDSSTESTVVTKHVTIGPNLVIKGRIRPSRTTLRRNRLASAKMSQFKDELIKAAWGELTRLRRLEEESRVAIQQQVTV